jgi:hypothetical protein
MPSQAMRSLVRACCIVAIAAFFGTIGIVILGWLGVPATSLRIAAATIMVLTLILQLAFVIAQMFASGRAPIPIQHLGTDAWMFVIVASGVPGAFWSNLAAFAGRPLDLIMPGFATPLFNAVLFTFARMLQQRSHRDLASGSHPPVA